MTPVETARSVEVTATCPLCHTVDRTVTPDSLASGATWKCARCGQTWSGEGLERRAAYDRFDAAHQRSVTARTR